MLRIGVVTLFPQMFDALSCGGIASRAMQGGILQLDCWNPRDYAHDRHRTVDDRTYGGGPGMVMQVAPLRDAIRAAKKQAGAKAKVLYLSPQGRRLDQAGAQELAGRESMVLVCGRYEGIDERLVSMEVDEEWSVGDYVLSGGEFAAMVLIDGVTRLLPGALGHEDSAAEDSFADGLLDHPHYTRPEEVEGLAVPDVLLTGNHGAVRRWRLKQSLGRTWLRRPDLLQGRELDEEQKMLLDEFVREHEDGDDRE